MSTDRIYIAKDGKSGKHVLVRILAIDDIGANYLPVDSNAFNELMMARDTKSLVLAAQGAQCWCLRKPSIYASRHHRDC